jgi:RimJ/RimL family protein N-acetyltransferase
VENRAGEFELDRLRLCRPRLSDTADLLVLFGDRVAVQHTLSFADIRQCRRNIAAHECQRRKTGYGPWTVLEKRSGPIIGFSGLYDDPFDPGWGIEIGYHFSPLVWGNGYATELTDSVYTWATKRLVLTKSGRLSVPTMPRPGRFSKRPDFKYYAL